MRKIQPWIEVNLFWENEIPHSEIMFFLIKACATIIANPEFYTLYNLPLPKKQHGAFSRNILLYSKL